MFKRCFYIKQLFLVFCVLTGSTTKVLPQTGQRDFLQSTTSEPIMQQANWQQKADFKIDVRLDDINNTLTGFISIDYYNNSPHSLSEIYMHLWPNAYRNNSTALAKQFLAQGKTGFYFSKPEDRGWIDSLSFFVDNSSAEFMLLNDIDICRIPLKTKLLPGKKINIQTSFFVKIPKVFSRFGHEDKLYVITQWYPKPAVFDVNGWNPIPYLDQGEFYSEYGRYEVNITLPKNYVVAATGVLQNKDEIEWLEQKSRNWIATRSCDTSTVSSDDTYKTLTFIQDNIHDFAWFASKKFQVEKSEVTLPISKRKVQTWMFDDCPKQSSIKWADSAILFYSRSVGEYPYSSANVVVAPLKAGGGMEYPMITNITTADKTIIVHELGHNWFYGILGSNEREYPWMDESFNTFYESKFTESISKKSSKGGIVSLAEHSLSVGASSSMLNKLMYYYSARTRTDQAGNLASVNYTPTNYGTIVYAKNPLAIKYLEAYLGKEEFEVIMKSFYEKWKFRHPLPNDLALHFTANSTKDISWFFNDALGSSKKMDYAIKNLSVTTLEIENKTNFRGPLLINAMQNDTVVNSVWVDGFVGKKQIPLSIFGNNLAGVNLYRIDDPEITMELYRRNNSIYTIHSENIKNAIPKISLLPNIENPNRSRIYVLPAYGYNYYNKSMLGLLMFNDIFPEQKTEFSAVPLYSFTTKDLNGYLTLARNFYPMSIFRKVQAGIITSRFGSNGYYTKSNGGISLQRLNLYGPYSGEIIYEKFEPYISFNLKKTNAVSKIDKSVRLRYVLINEYGYSSDYNYPLRKYFYRITDNTSYAIAEFKQTNSNVLFPNSFAFEYVMGTSKSDISRIGVEFKQSILYPDGKKTFDIRLFAGLFTKKPSDNYYSGKAFFLAGGSTGSSDFLYDNTMIARSENDQNNQFFERQILLKDAAFRNFAAIGNTDDYIAAINLTLPMPIKFPVGLFADFNAANILISNEYELKYNYVGGIYFSIAKDIAVLYFPFIASETVKSAWEINNLNHPFNRASFILNLNKINLLKLARELNI